MVYLGAMAALAGMTVLSSIIGYALPQLLPKIYTHYASIVLFAFFGFKLLSEAYEGYQQKVPKKNEELEEVEKELNAEVKKINDSIKIKDIIVDFSCVNSIDTMGLDAILQVSNLKFFFFF